MALGKETIPDGEAAAIGKVIAASRALLAVDASPVKRGQHPKHHGCVRAEFIVPAGLPPRYQVGLFREPKTYPAWIRFSNGAQTDDRKPDAHGMAIKLMGVPGLKILESEANETTHDFILVDNPEFFIANAITYSRFSTALLKARGKAPSALRWFLGFLPSTMGDMLTLALLYFFPFRLRSLAKLIAFATKRIASPLATQYWSTTPYLFGDGMAMKFTALPAVLDLLPPRGGSAYYLRDAMAEQLATDDVFFDFQVQLQKDERLTPVEDPTVAWPEDVSPFVTVARIRIPKQEFRGRLQMAFCENLSYNPWHAIPEHRPLGGINRVRKAVYAELSKIRHDRNETLSREPQPGDPPVGPLDLVHEPITFDQVLEDELELIERRRKDVEGDQPRPELVSSDDRTPARTDVDQLLMNARNKALNAQVTALSLSGGGIRAATFAVGFIQGLATLRLLKRFDYLSTVSGGGYAGGWVTAWLKRDGHPSNVEQQLNPSRVAQKKADRQYLHDEVVDEEPEPLRHLRSFSSYLSPHPGLFSVDTWTLILIWARNVVINLMMMFPAAMIVVALARTAVSIYAYYNPTDVAGMELGWWFVIPALMLLAGAGCLIFAFAKNRSSLNEFRGNNPTLHRGFDSGDVISAVNRRIVYPALVAVVLMTIPLRWALQILAGWLDRPLPEFLAEDPNTLWRIPWDFLRSHLEILDAPNFVLHVVVFGLIMAAGSYRNARRNRLPNPRKFAVSAFLAGGTGGVLLVLLEALTDRLARLGQPDLMATFIPPLGLLVMVAGLIVEVALLGRDINEGEREWWARLSAMFTLVALSWLAVMATIVYVPGLFYSAGFAARAAIASGWLGSAAFGVITGRYVLPKVSRSRLGVTAIASIAAQVFLVGLLGAVALLASLLINQPALGAPHGDIPGPFAYYLAGVKGAPFYILIAILVGPFVLYTLAKNLIDVNLFSLHAMYTNRLTRCYLGASRPLKAWQVRWAPPRDPRADAGATSLSNRPGDPVPLVRDANPVTGFDPKDDFDLVDVLIGSAGGPSARRYVGPHLLINATLNLVGGEELAWRDRKGESFTLSPLYCGSKTLGYAKSEETAGNLSLGSAVAISGAAIDPNMSYYQSTPLTALLTIFNARLGYWIETPKPLNWQALSPKFGKLFLTEFFGRTNGKGEYVHLSDGGHFENLGVYELIRRRARYIVALDAASDADSSDDSLATLIRLCRIDFGVRIKIDTSPLRVAAGDKLTKTHVAVGTIHYDDLDQGEMPGVLVYVKSSLTGDEPPDIQKYASEESTFPLQPTDFRQEFSEEQFESYRSLGDHIARSVFADPVDWVSDLFPESPMPPHRSYIPRLFSAVQLRWSEVPKDQDEHVLEASRGWSLLQSELSSRAELAELSRELYPELPPGPISATEPDPADRERAELYAVARMLEIMEAAWNALGLRQNSGLPMNRGWMNTFRRWAVTEAFQRTWPALRAERGAEFVRFCESQLHTATAAPSAIRLTAYKDLTDFPAEAVAELADEFAREWPDEARTGRSLPAMIEKAGELGLTQPPVWLVVQAPSGPEWADQSPRKFVSGIILATTFDDHPDRALLEQNGKTPVELFVWVRPPLRSAGLASFTVRPVIAAISGELKVAFKTTTPTLWARYPRSSADDDLEHGMWLGFFARFDFRRRDPTTPATGEPVTLLERVV